MLRLARIQLPVVVGHTIAIGRAVELRGRGSILLLDTLGHDLGLSVRAGAKDGGEGGSHLLRLWVPRTEALQKDNVWSCRVDGGRGVQCDGSDSLKAWRRRLAFLSPLRPNLPSNNGCEMFASMLAQDELWAMFLGGQRPEYCINDTM